MQIICAVLADDAVVDGSLPAVSRSKMISQKRLDHTECPIFTDMPPLPPYDLAMLSDSSPATLLPAQSSPTLDRGRQTFIYLD
jgi:hypothetical protein